ncbi:MAG: hypothetical protein CMI54_05240 [Parcubacteria group bacterium]|nr:hypothetical protein [Parcubacteria group bacterium]|tara:strand:- start:136 stop:399 length:264 start_codon:yes stop_codon:yes gene_type:complete
MNIKKNTITVSERIILLRSYRIWARELYYSFLKSGNLKCMDLMRIKILINQMTLTVLIALKELIEVRETLTHLVKKTINDTKIAYKS